MKNKIIILVITILAISGFGLWGLTQTAYYKNGSPKIIHDRIPLSTQTISIGSTTIQVEVADTDELRTQGLSGRSDLAPNTGMLFVFNKPGFYGFWMKDMNFPLDMIWIDGDKKVIDITRKATPNSFPKTFTPQEPVLYVLEVNPDTFINPVGQAVKQLP